MQFLGDFWYKKLSFKNGISVIFSKVFEAKINDVCLYKPLKPHFRQQEFFERSKKMKKRKLLSNTVSHSLSTTDAAAYPADANIATNQNVKERGDISHA